MSPVDVHALPLRVVEEVADALREGRPVVALESNVITHGLEHPMNVEAALGVEAAVRRGGAVPATIAIDRGEVLVGLDQDTIERFATTSREQVHKTSSRDLAHVLASGSMGATTVASSMVLAEAAGIGHFCSAGIGGVHRGAAQSFDISSDLIQLTRSRLVVVCAGAKNILDIGLTLEYLETQCVPVVSMGSDEFPAFYCRGSGHLAPCRLDDPHQVAELARTHWTLGSPTAVLVTTPPRREDAVDREVAEEAIGLALRRAEREGVTGKQVTRFLMRAVDDATGGRSARANLAVLQSTAELAGVVAAAAGAVEGPRGRDA